MVFQQKLKIKKRQNLLAGKNFLSLTKPVFANNKKAPPTSQRSFKI
jgi:hypothetical protein